MMIPRDLPFTSQPGGPLVCNESKQENNKLNIKPELKTFANQLGIIGPLIRCVTRFTARSKIRQGSSQSSGTAVKLLLKSGRIYNQILPSLFLAQIYLKKFIFSWKPDLVILAEVDGKPRESSHLSGTSRDQVRRSDKQYFLKYFEIKRHCNEAWTNWTVDMIRVDFV